MCKITHKPSIFIEQLTPVHEATYHFMKHEVDSRTKVAFHSTRLSQRTWLKVTIITVGSYYITIKTNTRSRKENIQENAALASCDLLCRIFQKLFLLFSCTANFPTTRDFYVLIKTYNLQSWDNIN